MVAPSFVEIRNVSKRFGDAGPVLDSISLSIASGEFVSLIGPSGCGKSTLLRLIAGLTLASSGTVTVDQKSPAETSTEIGFVFQDPTLLPWLTVARNVELPQKFRGADSSGRTTTRERVLELVRLSDKADAYPRQLSGGQRMRVSIARALALSPKLLLLDEPFGALDEMSRERLNEDLLTIRAQNAWTAVFVTHSVSEAVFLSQRIVVMAAHPGRIHAEFRIDLPYPRTADTRSTEAYHQYVGEISRSLRSVET
jgi:NitT/TauT family transport system ATP-binding protein